MNGRGKTLWTSAACGWVLLGMSLSGVRSARAATLDPAAWSIAPGLELSLFASEPDVVDPVALSFDERGRMYVVEMRDYPLGIDGAGKAGGTVRLLEDLNGDGKADRSVVFAEGLSFPTSIACWRGGVLVTAPPEILYLKDTNGDGRADEKKVILSGFKLGVTDSNLNGLRWGLDHRMHVANGGNGGKVVSAKSAAPAAVDLKDWDLRFDADSGEWEPTYHTGGGFGLVMDSWGNRFTTYNIDHIQAQMVGARYLNKVPDFFPIKGTVSVSDHGEMARIYPISVAVTRPNHPEQAGYFSSAGGLGYVGVEGWPGDLSGSVLVGDVVGNLVHRDVLDWSTGVPVAKRSDSEQTKEFLAGRDPAFRPVAFELGPDGALYLADMQRDVIEHPDYIPAKLKKKLQLRAGEDRGRIYRLAVKGSTGMDRIQWPSTPMEWGRMLSHSNQWWRMTASRVLHEAGAGLWVGGVRAGLSESGSVLGRLHALCVLQAVGALTPGELEKSLRDSEPWIQVQALKILEDRKDDHARFGARVLEMTESVHGQVRMQAAWTALWTVPAGPGRAAAASKLWRRDLEQRWGRWAALMILGDSTPDLLVRILGDQAAMKGAKAGPEVCEEALRELGNLSGRIAVLRGVEESERLMKAWVQSKHDVAWKGAVVDGLVQGWEAGGRPPLNLEATSKLLGTALKEAANDLSLARRILQLAQGAGIRRVEGARSVQERAATSAQDRNASEKTRLEALEMVGLGETALAEPVLLTLLQGVESSQMQERAARILCRRSDPSIATRLMEGWKGMGVSARAVTLNAFLSRKSWHGVLLDAVESGQLTLGELNLDLEQRRQLLRNATAANRARASRFWSDEEYSNRQAKVEEWLGLLPAVGSPGRGRLVFERVCAGCHRSGTVGHAVGPELTRLNHRSVEDLVSNILDPNMALNPAFGTVLVETKSGETWTGVMGRENASEIVVRQAQGLEQTLARRDMERLEYTGRSLMPEGLEAVMTPQELRDVVAFIQGE